MLSNLYISNFILIESININFKKGLQVLSGESGAGKSLILKAIGILNGDSFNIKHIRKDSELALIQGSFYYENNNELQTLLLKLNIKSNTLIICRKISKDKKIINSINDINISLKVLKDITNLLLDIHTQNSTIQLLNSNNYLSLLDSLIDKEYNREVMDAYSLYNNYYIAKNKLITNYKDVNYLDNIKNEYKLIGNITLEYLNDIELKYKEDTSKKRLIEVYVDALSLLDEDTINRLCRGIKGLKKDSSYKELEEAYIVIEDYVERFKAIVDNDESNELNSSYLEVEYYRTIKLVNSYGSIDNLEKRKIELLIEIDNYNHYEYRINQLDMYLKQSKSDYDIKATRLHNLRFNASIALETAMIQQLKELMLPNANFKIQIEDKEPSITGIDQVKFLISTNQGEELSDLNTTTSGGEQSRILLAFKIIFNFNSNKILIFDEIDNGISGSIAFNMSLSIYKLSLNTQVIVVTHLPSMIAYANNNYIIAKEDIDDSVITNIKEINDSELILYLSKLISNSVSNTSLLSSQELINSVKLNINNLLTF
ncbi:MAG: hypothetical protein RR646_01000 [Erysipelotrichaceae bacterium]